MTCENFEYVFNLKKINDLVEVTGKASPCLSALLN